MTTDDSTTRLLKACSATGLMLILCWLITPTLSSWHNSRLAARLVESIAESEDARVKVPLRQLADLGEKAIVPLVAAAASERSSVASIARQILDEKIATWKMLAENSPRKTLDIDFSFSAAKLATALAAQIEDFGPAGQQWAEKLALTMIDLTDRLPAQQSGVMLGHCSRVLAFVPPRGPTLQTLTSRSEIAAKFDSAFDSGNFLAPAPKLEPLTRSSERSLEILAQIRPELPSKAFQSQLQFAMPSRAQDSPASEPIAPELDWLPHQKSAAFSQQPPFVSAPSENQLTLVPKNADSASGGVVDIPDPQDMAERAETLRQLSSEKLLIRLGKAARFYEAGIVRAVLSERGYNEAELVLRQQLASSPATERLRLVEEVSRLSASAAQRMLRWLLTDDSGDVRLRALTALATTRSPDLTQLAHGLALRDDDPRVAKLASRLLREVR